MNFTGFNNADLTFNDSASLPRESLDHVYDRNNAYSAVFDQHSSGHFVSSQDPGNSHRHAHDFLRSGLKAGANQLIDETEVVTESVAQHKYSQLAMRRTPITTLKVMLGPFTKGWTIVT